TRWYGPPMDAPHLVVAGTPSIDQIEIRGETLATVGGSGFITAVAARRAGSSVGLIARVPRRLPDVIGAAFAPGGVDPGGLIPVDGSLPGFRISYDDSETATYLEIKSGNEAEVDAADVPRRWLTTKWIHIGPLAASSTNQLRFLERLLERGYGGGLSAGTFGRAAAKEPSLVRDLFERVDVAFLNRDEAQLIFPSRMPSRTVVCVTEGRTGVRRWDGSKWTQHPTEAVTAVDPTGAGDAFVGGYLGAMLMGDPNPVECGLESASIIVQGPGAAPLIDLLPKRAIVQQVPGGPDKGIAQVDPRRAKHVASKLRNAAQEGALAFTGSPFPESGDPKAIDVLTIGTLHQYGFWKGTDRGYGGPMWATIDGVRRKGSDFIWHAFSRAASIAPEVLDPDRLAEDPLLFDTICTADDGTCPIPDVGSHRVLQQAFGAAVGPLGGIRPLLDRANDSDDPLERFLGLLKTVPGFGEDPFAKKANLLALILAHRPERFLRLRGSSEIAPIVDYHIMRTTLRTGCVAVTDDDVRGRLEARTWVDAGAETGIRTASRDAIGLLCDLSGLDVASVDGFLFKLGRTVCLEAELPRCGECPLTAVCAQETDLFQPIFRTTAY
ncbi:MAG: carbohydrate kinase family protein, partial [Acidimicrobiia bacterium]